MMFSDDHVIVSSSHVILRSDILKPDVTCNTCNFDDIYCT